MINRPLRRSVTFRALVVKNLLSISSLFMFTRSYCNRCVSVDRRRSYYLGLDLLVLVRGRLMKDGGQSVTERLCSGRNVRSADTLRRTSSPKHSWVTFGKCSASLGLRQVSFRGAPQGLNPRSLECD
ncbi:hypothetical protein EDB92DRAFT_138886 [Lactarius akahatsu]|uniref:Uncharacterized protein n=1 Tax=Lactarius akahatsu TaxID=416441 RepID=A0AAD4L676_9AGAM|nr:hypothetical protein EDB92DRAFT_138886 [Lactarius akahatsu]